MRLRCFLFFLIPIHFAVGQTKVYDSYHQLMGVDFIISVVSDDATKATAEIDYAVTATQDMEAVISSWDLNSQTSAINAMAGQTPVKVDVELLELIERSLRVSELTEGAFDICIGPLLSVWNMDSTYTDLPDSTTIQKAKSLVDYQTITIDKQKQTVLLNKPGMRIGFGAIGKGFIAEYLKVKLQDRGIEAGMISAGGDITVWGEHPEFKSWRIGIADPDQKGKLIGFLQLKDNAVVTSGNYEKFIVIDGVSYTHIINPQTGFPVTGLKSVSVVCPNAELADALATACFVLGQAKGIELINKLNGIEAIFIDSNNKITTSNSFNYEKN